ncbi:helix-turn-helix domain-containing protein [Mycolicibacterium sp.]|uniref:helix-turn-helix domain-containing protein n=1 Tax=Mycolicibacterium sp. TaxID=2320850 RepID=UPI0037C8054E
MTQQTLGIPGRSFEHAVSDPDTRIRIAERAAAGESVSALAAEYGISSRTVMRYRDALSGGETA